MFSRVIDEERLYLEPSDISSQQHDHVLHNLETRVAVAYLVMQGVSDIFSKKPSSIHMEDLFREVAGLFDNFIDGSTTVSTASTSALAASPLIL